MVKAAKYSLMLSRMFIQAFVHHRRALLRLRHHYTHNQHLHLARVRKHGRISTQADGSVMDFSEIVRSGGVTGGFGWVQTHPLSKKAPMRFLQIRRLFWGWGGGGGRVEREKAWAVSDCAEQTATSTRCYYSVQLRSFIVAIIVGFETRSSYLLLIVA